MRVSERTVYEWAQKGEIPAGKIGTVWRFKESEIARWVDERLSAERPSGGLGPADVRAMLSTQRILFLNEPRKSEALAELAKNLATAPQIKNAQELASEIARREDLMSTAIGKGVAIPHARLQSVTDIVASVGISGVGVEGFGALDDEPVRIILMIAAPYGQHAGYLQALAFFSARLRDRDLRERLLSSGSAQEARDILLPPEPSGP